MKLNLNTKLFKTNDYILTTKFKVVLYFVGIMFAAMFMLNAIFYKMYSDNIKEVVVKELYAKLEQTSKNMDLISQNLENISEFIINNTQTQKLVDIRITGAYDEMNNMNMLQVLQGFIHTVHGVSSINMYLNDKEYFIASDYGVVPDLTKDALEWYEQIAQETDTVKWRTDLDDRYKYCPKGIVEYITLVRPVYSFATSKKSGILMLNFDKAVMLNLLRNEGDSSTIILDSEQKPIIWAYSGANNIGLQSYLNLTDVFHNENGFFTKKIKGVEYVFAYFTSTRNGWKYISFEPIGPSIKKVTKINSYIILFLFINFISILVLLVILSKKIFNPFNKLIEFMRRVENGDFNAQIEDNRKDEFGYVYYNFNKMVVKIRVLFGELCQEQMLKKDARIKLLQAKINPHFIYNIFDNMNWLIQLKRYNELETLVDSVAKYYKKSLNFGKDFIMVADTVEQLKSYSELQSIRFKERFTTVFDFEESVLPVMIPSFTLQPLLENAICHGIEPKREKCTITISGFRVEDKIILSIEDDGMGIDEARLLNIRECLCSEQPESENYFALVNVNRRIKLYYGEKYGLFIDSKKGTGTKVSVTIPGDAKVLLEEVIKC